MGWGSSTRMGGGRKLRARPRNNFVFLGFRREESGMSREFCPGCPGPLAVFKKFVQKNFVRIVRKAADTFKFLRHVMRAIWSVRPRCSHRCLSLKESPLKPVQSLKHTTKNSAEQTVMRTKWFKHIAI